MRKYYENKSTIPAIVNSGNFESALWPTAPIVNSQCSLQRLLQIRAVACSAYFESVL
jgi:hypothetical protein